MVASNSTASRATLQQLLQQMPGWKEVTSPGSHKVLSRIERCRTADFGYHAYRCSDSDCGPAKGGNMFTIVAVIAIALHVVTAKKKSG